MLRIEHRRVSVSPDRHVPQADEHPNPETVWMSFHPAPMLSVRKDKQKRSARKYILFTATHSLRSSPSGSMTAWRKFPLPSVTAACFMRSYWWVPSGMCFLGLNVLLLRLPLGKVGQNRLNISILLYRVLLFSWTLYFCDWAKQNTRDQSEVKTAIHVLLDTPKDTHTHTHTHSRNGSRRMKSRDLNSQHQTTFRSGHSGTDIAKFCYFFSRTFFVIYFPLQSSVVSTCGQKYLQRCPIAFIVSMFKEVPNSTHWNSGLTLFRPMAVRPIVSTYIPQRILFTRSTLK